VRTTDKQTNTLTNKQTLLKTSTSLRYATPVGNQLSQVHLENVLLP